MTRRPVPSPPKLLDLIGDALQDLQLTLRRVVMIARHAYRLDDANAKLARDDGSRHKSAARDADEALERPGGRQPPGKRTSIAVELVPGDREGFGLGL